ncbi:SDR family oxidoreductase [Lactiplantibacillus plantarum]|uniref:SDR family oxidoreductase n=1 Tax=Lactiplantibacillus plantarum TaxID=1590 RepID=UPI00077E02CB|nr:SDR family oxidoreductase [Lactiplantibacillus plantarum]AXH05317.1 NAD(P)-dependent oxidoreductase [Lactiplantibacillus plantarum]KYK06671.1 oxidoreductase [Lactiplantibacillus plantarum]MBO2713053.1 SDR family NAD(P)-dependent oxidoreductase [Lactiplantibacillus plantarum]MBP5841795.1 SDR family oxidoreductase [Lactiplantibacillus plantarum]MBS0953534.1 SDR family oxidoreductase [Lactiplantibacillus plantarum]
MSESKVIVITGASSGIGEATAKLVVKDGAKVILGARRENKLKKIADEIEKLGGEVAYQATDVTDDNQVEALAKLAIDKFGRIDVWLNNAGIMPQSILSEKKINDWNNMIDINIKGTLYGIGAAIPYMDKQKSGHIINVSSVAGHTAHSGSAVYSATKYAVRAISESLRQEMVEAKNNVRVTVISPGAINTDLLSSVTDPEVKAGMEKFYESFGISVDRVALTIKEAIDMPADAAWNEVIIRPTNQMG